MSVMRIHLGFISTVYLLGSAVLASLPAARGADPLFKETRFQGDAR
jgi:hypothetical protein